MNQIARQRKEKNIAVYLIYMWKEETDMKLSRIHSGFLPLKTGDNMGNS